MGWAGEPYEVDFFKNVSFLVGRFFLKMFFFAIGLAIGDLGAKIAAKFSQQRFLDVIF